MLIDTDINDKILIKGLVAVSYLIEESEGFEKLNNFEKIVVKRLHNEDFGGEHDFYVEIKGAIYWINKILEKIDC